MRLKNVPGSGEVIENCPFVINEPEKYFGKWNEFFGNSNPIHIEVGMGKGNFITALASQNKEINYIGIEKYSSVLIRALEKREELECNNLFFLCFDADKITELFAKDEISRIYLNFSDPWPKVRHAKRRLTSTNFLEKYRLFLRNDGHLEFKTDNRDLFDFSVEEFKDNNWSITTLTYDLHHSEYALGNIMTEYEEKFSSLGNPINKLVASP